MGILIVDDDQEICILLKNIFKGMNIETDSAHTLEEGKAKLRDINPSIVFLDINLPDGNGISNIKEFKRKNHPRVVMISANENPGDVQRAFHEGADEFLKKPFTRQQIIDTINQFT